MWKHLPISAFDAHYKKMQTYSVRRRALVYNGDIVYLHLWIIDDKNIIRFTINGPMYSSDSFQFHKTTKSVNAIYLCASWEKPPFILMKQT